MKNITIRKEEQTTIFEYNVNNETGTVEVGGIMVGNIPVIWLDPIKLGPIELSLEEAECVVEALTEAIKELKK